MLVKDRYCIKIRLYNTQLLFLLPEIITINNQMAIINKYKIAQGFIQILSKIIKIIVPSITIAILAIFQMFLTFTLLETLDDFNKFK
jgi:hypothetical protein